MKAMKEITEIDQVLKLAKPLQLRLRIGLDLYLLNYK